MHTSWSSSLTINGIVEDFKYPEIFALATNSVQSEFNRNPSEPRYYSISDQSLTEDIKYFKAQSIPSYALLNACNIEELKTKIRRKALYSGSICSLAGMIFF